jgi:glycosyltransferase involved in cell wall biosynthesis
MAAATVTVGIPTFNRAPMLEQAIESVLAQTFTGFRLVISDNASTDATTDLVRSFDDGRIEYLRSERNVGATANLNRLIGLADTEFLVLLPDDDLPAWSCCDDLARSA